MYEENPQNAVEKKRAATRSSFCYKKKNNKQTTGTLLATCRLACSKFMALIATTTVHLGKRTRQPWLGNGHRHDNYSYEEAAAK